MSKLSIIKRKLNTVIKKPETILLKILLNSSRLFGDEIFLKLLYRIRTGETLNLDKPKNYNEKLQWLKLYYRKPELKMMVDKYESKKYVSNLIGDKYVIPNLGVWGRFEEINFDNLPNQFVLKTTHDQGGVVVCKNKETFDINAAKRKLNKHLRTEHFYLSREWPYKDIPPRILAEKYMVGDDGKDLNDFKFFCFNGEPKALFVATERQSGKVKFDYYNMKFEKLDIQQNYERSSNEIDKPCGFDKMVEFAKVLSAGLPHVRVDLYDIKGQIYFGELTFFHHGGLAPFNPRKWNDIFGSWIQLPSKHIS